MGAVHYEVLILATGAEAIELPGEKGANLHALRNLDDARSLRDGLHGAQNIIVVGGGFIGIEVAATAAKLGKSVYVIEAQSWLLTRVLPGVMAEFITDQHRAHCTTFHFDTRIAKTEVLAERAISVTLNTGQKLPSNLLLVGIGSKPKTALENNAGLALHQGGVLVDTYKRASDPHIYAIGDCAVFPSALTGDLVRLESVQNAVDQARCVARNICGDPMPYSATPWFWTDQFDMKIQMVDLPVPNAAAQLRGPAGLEGFSVIDLSQGRISAAYSLNAPKRSHGCPQAYCRPRPHGHHKGGGPKNTADGRPVQQQH